MSDSDYFNRSLSPNKKIKYFFGAWLLSTIILLHSLVNYLAGLGQKNIVSLPEEFSLISYVWGEGVLLNALKLLVAAIAAFGFGIIYGYLSRKITLSDKVSVSFTNSVLTIFGIPLAFLILLIVVNPSYGIGLFELIFRLATAISENSVVKVMIILQLLVITGFTYLGLLAADFKTRELPEEKGKLLGVKWFHYIWLAPALSIYLQAIYWLLYRTLRTLMTFFKDFNLSEFFGISESSKGADATNLSNLSWKLLFLYLIAYLIFRLTLLQREVLDSNSKSPKIKTIPISILFAIIVPFLLLLYIVSETNNG